MPHAPWHGHPTREGTRPGWSCHNYRKRASGCESVISTLMCRPQRGLLFCWPAIWKPAFLRKEVCGRICKIFSCRQEKPSPAFSLCFSLLPARALAFRGITPFDSGPPKCIVSRGNFPDGYPGAMRSAYLLPWECSKRRGHGVQCGIYAGCRTLARIIHENYRARALLIKAAASRFRRRAKIPLHPGWLTEVRPQIL